MDLQGNKIIFDSGIIAKDDSTIQLLVYWNSNIKSNSHYPSVGYLEIELNRNDNCLFSILFCDEIRSRANEIPDITSLEICPITNTSKLIAFLPQSQKQLILTSANNIWLDETVKFHLSSSNTKPKRDNWLASQDNKDL